jgi:hypothetical protein
MLVAALALVVPTVVASLARWDPSEARTPHPLNESLIAAMRDEIPVADVVYADPESSYRFSAFVTVRICVAPPGHVADTKANRPRDRVEDFRRFVRTLDTSIPRACGARWLLADRERFPQLDPDPGRGHAVYRDARWSLFRIGS